MVFHVKLVERFKSQLKVKWFLAIFIILIITTLILSRLVFVALSALYQKVAEQSSENVAIQLSSLMSAIGAVVERIDVEYVPSKDVLYDVKVDEDSRSVEAVAKFEPVYIQKLPSKSEFCTSFKGVEFKDVNRFIIQKKRENGNVHYLLIGGKVEDEG